MLKSILKFYEYFKTYVHVIYLPKILARFNITTFIEVKPSLVKKLELLIIQTHKYALFPPLNSTE